MERSQFFYMDKGEARLTLAMYFGSELCY